MIPRISRFERRIILAILVCATTPFIISLIFIPSIIESKLAMSMHAQVAHQLEDSAVFYKEFFGAKKKEYTARAETIARDPILIRAAREEDEAGVKNRFEQVLADNQEIRSLRIRKASGEVWLTMQGPENRLGPDYRPKTIAFPLGLGEAPRLEATFILSAKYLERRGQAEDIAELYKTSRQLESKRAQEFYLAYFGILAVVVMMSIGVGFWLSRGVTKRIFELAKATERVGKGESGFEIPIQGADEITELTQGFNRMIEEVVEARDRIIYLEKVSGWQDLARRLAHEIKNPLTPIRLAVQELKRRAPESEPRFKKLVEDATDVVEEEITALTRLVDEFSQFARLPAVTPTNTELKEFISHFLESYNYFDPEAEVELRLPAEDIYAPVDLVLMRRVLANLVQNSIQAQKGTIKLRLGCTVGKTGRALLTVEDDGPGIPEEHGQQIFEPYFTTKNEGTGLGLAIVKKIVLQHEGVISFSISDLGGACFTISLPATSRNTPE